MTPAQNAATSSGPGGAHVAADDDRARPAAAAAAADHLDEGRTHALGELGVELAVGNPRDGANEAVVVLIAGGEAAGLWVPFLVVPWARFSARVWGSLYALGAATAAALSFYFPFDGYLPGQELIAPDGPPYLLAAIACLPVAGVGYLMGWLRSQNERASE